MLSFIRRLLNRPLAEDFSFRPQLWSALRAGLYVFLFVEFIGSPRFVAGQSPVLIVALLAFGCAGAALLANYGIPRLFPRFYDEDQWTVGRHALHTLSVLLCISAANQLVLWGSGNEPPPFGLMVGMVTLIGFFPITVGVLLAEQRQLRRNLAQARALTQRLDNRPRPAASTDGPANAGSETNRRVRLQSDTGKDSLSLWPGQLLYVESVGNYVAVHWRNGEIPQKTVLRATLRAIADELANFSVFFRCHRAFIVNLNAVTQATGNARGYQLTLDGCADEVPVSRSFVAALEQRMATISVPQVA
jgi:hypothetical protein